MAAAAVAGPAALPDPQQQQQSFTPLHLFECTITNAGMLVDSMPTRDLVTALRVLSSLHIRIVDVMEPSVGVACQLADHHRSHCPPGDAEDAEAADDPGCLLASAAAAAAAAADYSASNHNSVSSGGGGGSRRRHKVKRSRHSSYGANSSSAAAAMMKCETLDVGGGGGSDDDDCLMVIEDSSMAAAAAGASSGVDFCSSGLDVAGSSTPELRAALKASYKELKSAGAELFDFSRPFDDLANVQVANRVIACAQARIGSRGYPMEVWRGSIASLRGHFKCAEDRHAKQKANTRKHNRKYAKLSRRQKSFEALLPELSPDELEEYRLVLTRDFTTSDEESEDERGRERLRTRELPWESDRVRAIKRRLDELFLKRFATVKQRDQIARCLRDGSARSGRPPPDAAPAWALRLPPPTAGSNGGGSGGEGGGADVVGQWL